MLWRLELTLLKVDWIERKGIVHSRIFLASVVATVSWLFLGPYVELNFQVIRSNLSLFEGLKIALIIHRKFSYILSYRTIYSKKNVQTGNWSIVM